MITAPKKQFLCLLLVVMTAGCGASESTSDHTHLWTADQAQHVWSYERVTIVDVSGGEKLEPQSFLKREMLPGESISFDGGAVVSYNGSELRVGKQLINVKNVHVERDGSIRLNAFIRASN